MPINEHYIQAVPFWFQNLMCGVGCIIFSTLICILVGLLEQYFLFRPMPCWKKKWDLVWLLAGVLILPEKAFLCRSYKHCEKWESLSLKLKMTAEIQGREISQISRNSSKGWINLQQLSKLPVFSKIRCWCMQLGSGLKLWILKGRSTESRSGVSK